MLQRKRQRRERLRRMQRRALGQAERVRHAHRLHRKQSNLVVTENTQRYQFIADRHKTTIVFPEVFSFLDDPEGTLAFFSKFRAELGKRFIKNLTFDHSRCATLGLDAITLTDAFLLEEMQRRGDDDLSVGGIYPKSLELKIMFKAIGTIRAIQHPEMQLPADVEARIERGDLYRGKGKSLKRAKERDDAATSLVEYFDRVLGHQGYSLTPEGQAYFGDLITEVIGNAEEHSGRWYTRAFSRASISGKDELQEAQIVIINFGKTIYESLSARSASQEMKEDIEALAELHRRERFFSSHWNEECLWTLCALQQGVSRYTATQKGLTLRGRGTVTMIKAFSELAVKPLKMCVLSGSAYLTFDGTYELYETQIDGQPRQQISFNKESDLRLPPDKNFVYSLKNRFPGTIISLRFSLNAEHLDEVMQEKS